MSGKKDLIIASALKMLEQKEYRQISVLDLVSDSGVNRNTFYYHFKDMPSLVTELAKRGIDRAFSSCRGGSNEKLMAVVELLYKNRTAALHVYNSADRAQFDKGLEELCGYLAAKLCIDESGGKMLGQAESFVRLMAKASFYGFVSSWFAAGLDEQGRDRLIKICIELSKAERN